MNGRPSYNKAQLLKFLLYFYDEHGRVPQRRDFEGVKNTPLPSFAQFQDVFGSWGNAILATGLRSTIRARSGESTPCIYCGKMFYVTKATSKRMFCSLECSHKFEFGTKGRDCAKTHKTLAVLEYGNVCERCGNSEFNNYYSKRIVNSVFDKVPVSVHVHHIDGDRKNNDIRNLCILCPNCHNLDRVGITIYWRDPETNKLCWKDKTLDEWNAEIAYLKERKRDKAKVATRKCRERMRQSTP